MAVGDNSLANVASGFLASPGRAFLLHRALEDVAWLVNSLAYQVAHMSQVRCLVCGGDHDMTHWPHDEAGMDREIQRLGNKRWNRLASMATAPAFKRILAQIPQPNKAPDGR